MGAGVEVADALVVGEEGDPAGDEHGGVEVAAEVGQQAFAVQPEPARGAAPVALPGGRFVRWGAGEQEGLAVGDLDVGDRAPGELAARGAVGGDLVRPGEVGEGLAVGGDGEDGAPCFSFDGRPSADLGVRAAPVGEPPGRTRRPRPPGGSRARGCASSCTRCGGRPARSADGRPWCGRRSDARRGRDRREEPARDRPRPRSTTGRRSDAEGADSSPPHAFPGDGPEQLVKIRSAGTRGDLG